MGNIDKLFRVDPGLSILDKVGMFYGTDDPHLSPGYEAPKGSLFFLKPSASAPVVIFFKYDVADTAWRKISGEGEPRYFVPMAYNGTGGSGKWLDVFAGIASNVNPFLVPEVSVLRALSVIVNGLSTVTLSVYKNSTTLLDTLSLSGQASASKRDLTYPLAQGDTIGVKITAGSANNIVFGIFLQVV